MSNDESGTAENAPETVTDEASVTEEAPEVPATPEAPAAAAGTKKNTGLIAGASTLTVLLIAAIVVCALGWAGVFKSSPDPKPTVTKYFASKTCNDLQAQLADAAWKQSFSGSTAQCTDSAIAQGFGALKVTIKDSKVDDDIATVNISVASTSDTSTPAQAATINLVLIKGAWKVDHIIAAQ